MGVALATADGIAGDDADDGLRLDADVVGTAANVDGGTTLGVALGAVAQAEPSKAKAINQRRIRRRASQFQAPRASALSPTTRTGELRVRPRARTKIAELCGFSHELAQ